jgi:translocation and assembly module TamB
VTAKDIAYGSVTGRGTISFQKGWTPSFDLRLELEKITLAQTDEIKGLASGPIFLKGFGSEAKLFGTLDVLSLIYDFGDQKALPRTLQLMDEADKETSPKLLAAKSQAISRPSWIPLNLVLNLKKPLVIRGEGLKSDWQGNIALEGDLKKSYLVGHLQLVGGGFEFFGKKLKLTAGTMDFDRNAPNDPQIMLRAMREAMSLIIYFQITGRASNPAFAFSSMPPLPVEEIVARLLFDKSLGEMSSMQGLQVASALASLQTASGLNVFNKLRNVFGLDVLEFKQTAPEPSQTEGHAQGAISLGKQVSEHVYVRAEQGLGADSSKVGVEVKVTPQLSVEADVGGAQGTGAGLNWSKRY